MAKSFPFLGCERIIFRNISSEGSTGAILENQKQRPPPPTSSDVIPKVTALRAVRLDYASQEAAGIKGIDENEGDPPIFEAPKSTGFPNQQGPQ